MWKQNLHLMTDHVCWGRDRWNYKWSRNNWNRNSFIISLSFSATNDKNSTINEWTILSLSTVFFFNAQFLFNAFGGLMIQCWRWLQWKKKVEIFKNIYIYIYLGMRLVSYSEWMEYLCNGIYLSRMALWGEIFERQNEIKTDVQNVGLEIPAEWAWFLCKTLSQGDQNSCVLFCQLSMYGKGYCMWAYSLPFLERIIIKWLNFYKKKIFSKT